MNVGDVTAGLKCWKDFRRQRPIKLVDCCHWSNPLPSEWCSSWHGQLPHHRQLKTFCYLFPFFFSVADNSRSAWPPLFLRPTNKTRQTLPLRPPIIVVASVSFATCCPAEKGQLLDARNGALKALFRPSSLIYPRHWPLPTGQVFGRKLTSAKTLINSLTQSKCKPKRWKPQVSSSVDQNESWVPAQVNRTFHFILSIQART